jgi:thiosulfate/3-mercaptopyruvate sulfurtransferase
LEAGPLISVDELRGVLGGGDPPTVLDARWQFRGPPALADYRAAHVPGAVFVDVDRALVGAHGTGLLPLPEGSHFGAAMRECGVRTTRPVVVYDASDATSAAGRAWWLLRYFGHEDVRVLDGGFAAWRRRGLPTSREPGTTEAGDFVADPGHLPLVEAGGAAEIATGGVLLDTRSLERFRGDVEPYYPVAGHVPGAVSAPASGNVDEDGRLLTVSRLRRRFEGLGVRAGMPVAAYCGAGVVATQTVLALELAGFEPALYLGSWSDWIDDPARPVETGDTSPTGGDGAGSR